MAAEAAAVAGRIAAGGRSNNGTFMHL